MRFYFNEVVNNTNKIGDFDARIKIEKKLSVWDRIKTLNKEIFLFFIKIMDEKTIELENEIRKLKLQLLKEELNDKLITLNSYLVNKTDINRTQSSTVGPSSSTVTLSTESSNETILPMDSILFARIHDEFLVWHLVLFILVLWLLIGNKSRFSDSKFNFSLNRLEFIKYLSVSTEKI